MLVVVAAVVVQDQAAKWWAWRHLFAVINPGATGFLGARPSALFTAPAPGALLDLAGLALLSVALVALLRRPRRRLTLVAGAVLVGGWTSNVLDRLGMHGVTAPGTERGAVDFIPFGPYYYNVADLYIAGAAAALLLAAMLPRLRRVIAESQRHRRAWPGSPAVAAGMCLVCATSVLVVVGSLPRGTQPAAATAMASRVLSRWGQPAGARSSWSPNSSRSASA